MPLITEQHDLTAPASPTSEPTLPQKPVTKQLLKQSSHSSIARSALMNNIPPFGLDGTVPNDPPTSQQLPVRPVNSRAFTTAGHDTAQELKLPPSAASSVHVHHALAKDGVGYALSDTPNPTAPNSPRIPPIRTASGSSTPRIRPTTLDIPGLTKSTVSPDGRIAQRDLGAKLLVVMVGLPARGKSYITKKMARYLNWLQHDARIFNVGERRRIAAGGGGTHNPEPSPRLEKRPEDAIRRPSITTTAPQGLINQKDQLDPPQLATKILVNGQAIDCLDNGEPTPKAEPTKEEKDQKFLEESFPELTKASTPQELPDTEQMDQSANFFDPNNRRAALIREQCAMETLDEAIEYLTNSGGSVAILDATNSTLERRAAIMRRVRERCGEELNVLYVESVCQDEQLLESNMRLKLSGPDYKDKDPVAALEDFKKRVAIYERAYVPLGEYEEKNNMAYVQMIDVGRKVISHQIKGFIAAQAVYYLLNFNLSPRTIWITRHGESMDNVNGKIGGDSDLSPNGHRYARALANFIKYEREAWDIRQREKTMNTHFPPQAGDMSPPNPYFMAEEMATKNCCVWTSMLKRSIQTAEFFDEEEFDLKQMRMLDELNAGFMEGMTYEEIRERYAHEYEMRKQNKLQYRYPGPGGEGYLDVINRLRPVIVELERMTDHCLLITHRSVARVLLAYFLGLARTEIADIECPLGMLYMLEPKPYGVQFKAFRYNPQTDWFDHIPNFKPRPAPTDLKN